MALCADIGEEELKQKVEHMKTDMKQKDVVMAVGTVWQEDWKLGLDILLTESESRMYEEKAAYYKNTGIDQRH